jgi:UPF0271 protein
VIDLSADLAEGAAGEDEIWPLVTSANVACGGHTGDLASMTHAATMAARFGVRVGAHPSYPDREDFGRRSMQLAPEDLRASLVAQIESLRAIAAVYFVKAHGALYNDAHRDTALARLLAEVVRSIDPSLAIVCADRSASATEARVAGLRVIREAFADRRYEPDGALMSRQLPGSLLTVAEAAFQAKLLASEGTVVTRDGSRLSLPFDTLCVHADMEHAVERLRAVRTALGRS